MSPVALTELFGSGPVRCLIDFDDTLVDYAGEEAAAVRALRPADVDQEDWARAYRAAKTHARRLHPEPTERQYRQRLALALAAVGAPATPQVLDGALDTYWRTRRGHVRLLPSAANLLRWLRERTAHVGLCTHGVGRWQRERLRIAGIADCFDTVLVSGEVGATKADWVRFLGRHYQPTAPYLVISDQVRPDLVAAAELDMFTVLVAGTGDGSRYADLAVSSLTELLGQLRSIRQPTP